MSEMVLLGDEAVAMGAIDAGLSAAYGYPGTPATEILEFILEHSRKQGRPHASWCSNEKTAYETALGTSLMGRRALVTMKHVGLNVAADPFINSALLAVHGGLVLAVADDPGMHSSQNEQDSRCYADFARVICLEPRNQQEAYEMSREAFELSERFHIPVLIKLVTRLSHSRAVVRTGERRPENPPDKSKDRTGWITLPAISRRHWEELLEAQEEFLSYSEASAYNPLELNGEFSDFGVITTGLGGNYFEENLPELAVKPSRLHIGVYPIPVGKVRALAGRVKRIVMIEEGYPFVERYLRGILPQAVEVAGKLSGHVPASGELTPDSVRSALGLKARKGLVPQPPNLPGRPPQLCAGCPHRDTFEALNLALSPFVEKLVTSDIGCYTLGFLPPFQAVETCLCMGASVGMAKGAAEAGLHPAVATIGDSTFLHSGIPGLVDAVSARTPLTLVILDNGTTAMTGGQPTIVASADLEPLILGLGVEPGHCKRIVPLKKNTQANAAIIRAELDYRGVSVILAQRECIRTSRQKHREGGRR